MEEGKDPGQSWKESAETLCLDMDIKHELDTFFRGLGRMDKTSQLDELQRITEIVETEREQAKQKATQKAKLRTTLGVLIGATAVIVML